MYTQAMLTDAHVHLYDCFLRTGKIPDLGGIGAVCASAHGEGEFSWQESLARRSPCRILLSFGVHPQEPLPEGLAVLDSLAAAGRIHAVGEAGFDAWNDSFRSTLKAAPVRPSPGGALQEGPRPHLRGLPPSCPAPVRGFSRLARLPGGGGIPFEAGG